MSFDSLVEKKASLLSHKGLVLPVKQGDNIVIFSLDKSTSIPRESSYQSIQNDIDQKTKSMNDSGVSRKVNLDLGEASNINNAITEKLMAKSYEMASIALTALDVLKEDLRKHQLEDLVDSAVERAKSML